MKILYLGYMWPEPQASAAGQRTWQLIETFLYAGWEVHFGSAARNRFPGSSTTGGTVGRDDRFIQLGVETHELQLNHSSFGLKVASLKPDAVVYDRAVTEEQYGWRVRDARLEALQIIDAQDLYFLRTLRGRALNDGLNIKKIAQGECKFQGSEMWRELASLHRVDLTLLLSDVEKRIVVDHGVPESKLHVGRFHMPIETMGPQHSERRGFVWIGNLRHAPNIDGLFWLYREVWPKMRAFLPGAEVTIIGAYPPREVMELHDPANGFHVKGWVQDPKAVFLAARVNLATLRFGAGIKGKIALGWSLGLPVVTTSIGAEGMAEDFPWGGEVADSPESFAQAAVKLHEDPLLWSQRQENGWEILKRLYDPERERARIIHAIGSLRGQTRHSPSVVEEMIRFHSDRGSRYFSKWIELKEARLPISLTPQTHEGDPSGGGRDEQRN